MIADRWGATAEEIAAHYPCDDLVPEPTLRAWRAVSVLAPAEAVWSWVIQVRVAPYSYDWIDNGGRRSPRTHLDLVDPRPGDPFSETAGRPLGEVLSVVHADHLTARVMGATLSYRLVPHGPRHTRLVLKIVGTMPRPVAALLCVGDLVMARRQLLNFKTYAEASAITEPRN